MKQGRVMGITIAVINLILITVCGGLYLRKDREKPRFEFETSGIVYSEGMDTAGLLEGVRAYDTVDGDVSSRIVIEKITGDWTGGYGGTPGEETGKDSVTVFYAVSDKAGNVAKASRVFEAVFDGEENREENSRAESFPGAGIDAELKGRMQEPGVQEGRTPESTEEEDASAMDGNRDEKAVLPMPSAAASPVPAPSPTPTASPETFERRTPEHSAETLPAAGTEAPLEENRQEQALQAAGNAENSAAPVLTLKVSEVKVKAGQGPAWVDLISILSDDRDNYETLFRNLHVDRYDRDKPGTYQVNVHTEDSDGNVSRNVPLTIIVE